MHELVAAFEAEMLPLNRTLCEMLGEAPSHRTERRGCGFTQATRFLAALINQPRAMDEIDDLEVFGAFPRNLVRAIAIANIGDGWVPGWRRLGDSPAWIRSHQRMASEQARLLIGIHERMCRVRARLSLVESALLFDMIFDLLTANEEHPDGVPAMREKPEIGSCSQAEEFFLEIAHGRIRRQGSVNIIVDHTGRALMLEKMNLGESHSAIALEPIRINRVLVPAGALFALRYPEEELSSECGIGVTISSDRITAARFLRLTTLSVSPAVRRRAFSAQVEAQVNARMVSPLSTTLDDLRKYAAGRLGPGG